MRKADADFVKQLLTTAFKSLQPNVTPKHIIYTGHGVPLNGAWCLEDSEFEIDDLEEILPERLRTGQITVHSCYSHLWQQQFIGSTLQSQSENYKEAFNANLAGLYFGLFIYFDMN